MPLPAKLVLASECKPGLLGSIRWGLGKFPDERSRRQEPGGSSGSASQSNKAKSRMEERQQVVEEYIASLRDFMKSILRNWN